MSDQNNKTTMEELDRTCVVRGRFIERSDGGESEREETEGKSRKGMISGLEEASSQKKEEKSDLEKIQNKRKRERVMGM